MKMARLVVLVLAIALLGAASAHAQAGPADKCAAGKMKAAGKRVLCELVVDAKVAVKGGTPDYTKCVDKFVAAYAKLEAKGGCATTSISTEGIACRIDAFVSDIFRGLANPGAPAEVPPVCMEQPGPNCGLWCGSPSTCFPCSGCFRYGDCPTL